MFQREMDVLLTEVRRHLAVVYLDDIIIYSPQAKDRMARV